jgi:hypothetical protein
MPQRVPEPHPHPEEHGEPLVHVRLRDRAGGEGGLGVLADVPAAVDVGAGVKDVGDALRLRMVEIVVGADHIAVGIAVRGDVSVEPPFLPRDGLQQPVIRATATTSTNLSEKR